MRQLNSLDNLLNQVQNFLNTNWGSPQGTGESSPADELENTNLSQQEKEKSIALMRVNHTGEVCAQALYQSQYLLGQSEEIKNQLKISCQEENNHLIWCEKRINELGGKVSYLNPLFYMHSYLIGAIAGSLGDQYSLGFLLETEKQVEQHLSQYLDKLPQKDLKSQEILKKMREDEIKHGQKANDNGAIPLPKIIKILMNTGSKLMTKTTYYL